MPPQQQPQQSPISAPRPGLGPESIRPGPLTWREVWGYVFWGGLGAFIGVFEILAAVAHTPWPTISSTVGMLERHHPWIAILVLAGLVILAARIVFYPWPNRMPDH